MNKWKLFNKNLKLLYGEKNIHLEVIEFLRLKFT